MLGSNRRVQLYLLNKLSKTNHLANLWRRLIEDGTPVLENAISTSNYQETCQGIYFAVLIVHFGRETPKSKFSAMEKNFGIYRALAQSLGAHANTNCKGLLVSHPASLGTIIFQQFAPQIPSANITALTRADHDKAVSDLLHVVRHSVPNVIVWGINSIVHGDSNHAVIDNLDGSPDAVRGCVHNDAWIMDTFQV